ncbi:hypothetical protein [Pseudomonas chlororaphis]|uniref:hypothetical protein n=1 Tax=Pseudomonas chlororaphis TaxID=587753 RepID=UPI00236760B6|nr:hypothetical protein [Pseudomonas chlororaphis]WDG45715.1 hypothetical protein PUP58_18295 [Pseudomonas chlororaphis]
MSNNEMVSGSRELLERVATEADYMLGFSCAANYDECRGAVDELIALLAAPVPVWNPHPAEANLAALLILLAQSGVKVSGGIGDEPWIVEPVPPAGGEPKVLGYSVKGNRYAIRLTKGELLGLCESYTGDALIELVDRAHVTRLQAALRTEVEAGDSWKREAQDLRAELDALKAQPQGEPVAFQWRCKTVNEGSQWRHWVDCTEEDYNKTIENPGPNPRGIIREARKLYTRPAEPPAPVAVVLPARKTAEEYYTRLGNCNSARLAADEFNSALDEVARLNSL